MVPQEVTSPCKKRIKRSASFMPLENEMQDSEIHTNEMKAEPEVSRGKNEK
jgi:hypothetical protein